MHIYRWQTKQNTQWQRVQYKNMDNLIEMVEMISSVNQHTICQFYNKQDIVVWK